MPWLSWTLGAALLMGVAGTAALPSPAQQASAGEDPLSGLEVHPEPEESFHVQLAKAQAERHHQIALKIARRYRTDPERALHIVRSAHWAAEKHGIDPLLLLGIVAVESSFNPKAESPKGAMGLTQAMEKWHPEKFARIQQRGQSPFGIGANLDMGGQIYAEYLRQYRGNHTQALQQYNGSLGDPSLGYSSKVLAAKNFLAHGLPTLPVAKTERSVARPRS